MQIGDVVTDKNGVQVVVSPESEEDLCRGCHYYSIGGPIVTMCLPVTRQDGTVGCADGKFIFKLQE